MPAHKKSNKVSFVVPPENCALPPCEPGKCRVNSRRNPNCVCQLGEKFWFSPIKENYWTSFKDPESERKEEGGYVGLKNLGATCYVNTFLQLWFNNKAFRSAIYQWKGLQIEPVEIVNEEGNWKTLTLSFGEKNTSAICGSLQYLFSLLQYSERRYVDPLFFVKSLGLQTDEQQDAQEFSKLFMSLLQDLFQTQNEHLSNVVHSQFGGSYKYQTKCNICGNISENGSEFYELDLNIKGHHKLSECLKEFLKEEILDGENKYFCSRCQMKQNATRRIILKKLPPVLNIQLLRFVFDRQTGTKKKLNTTINFPNTIDMNEYMEFTNKEEGLYQLTSVLIHCGLSAHSGHYIAHILDRDKDVWCRYNDESVTVMKGKSLNLGKEDDPELVDEEKSKKTKKGDDHNSKNAYMLVYSRAASTGGVSNIPENMMEYVCKDNSLFEEWVSFNKHIRNQAIEEGQEKQRFIQEIYPTLPAKSSSDCEWILTSWLRQWLNHDSDSVPSIDNTSLLCIHSSADPLKISMMKRISKEAADKLFSRFGGASHLPGESLCKICLENNKKKEEFEAKLAEDVKQFNKTLKEGEKGFWVSKKSLKSFKQMARDRYALINEQNKQNRVTEMEGAEGSDGLNESDTGEEKMATFQQDIICSNHGNMSLNENIRKTVPIDVWNICLSYFPDAPSFPQETQSCPLCQRELLISLEEKKTMKFLAQEQKQCLSFLLEDSEQRMYNIISGIDATFHVILSSFISTWKKIIRNGGHNMSLTVDNSEIVCEHDLLLYTAEEIIDECMGENPEVFLVSENEYDSIKRFYPVSDDVKLLPVQDKENNQRYEISPDYCPSCRNDRLMSDAEDSRHYTSASIFISKRMKKDIFSTTNSDSSDDIVITKTFPAPENPILKDFYAGGTKEEDTKSYTISTKRLNLTGEMRRSNRKRMKRGEYMIQVNSHQSLKELKIQILGLYSVLPIEQTLSIDGGSVLEGDDSYLIDLGITPGCHLILMVDEPSKQILHDPSDKPRVLEAGFKGTSLVCGSQS